MSARIPVIGGACTVRCTSSRTSTRILKTRKRISPQAGSRSKTICSKTAVRGPNGSTTICPRRSPSSITAAILATRKQLFTVANCAACHKLNGVGTELGPDLSKLDPKLQAADILKEMLDPSAVINEKYQTYVITLEDGKTLTGLITSDSIDGVTIVENPLAGAKPVVVKPREIAEREKAAVSVMPKGLLDKLSRDEIMDLVAYIVARGSQEHPVFQGGGHNHHDHKH